MILQLQKADPQHALVPKAPLAVVPPQGQLTLTLEGVTPRAAAALPVTPFPITHFPFRIGRQSPDPLVYNASSVPILPQGEQFPRVICLLAFLCSHYKIRLYQKICLDYIS